MGGEGEKPQEAVPEADANEGGEKKSGGEKATPKKGKTKEEAKAEEQDDLSPEDRALLEGLELSVERAGDENPEVVKMALEHLRTEIRTSTSSMTSVPKPLKFLRPHYGTLTALYEKMAESEVRLEFADILSVLAMTMGAAGKRETLNFKLKGNRSDLGSWGHEYIRALAGEVGDEYNARMAADTPAAGEEMAEVLTAHAKGHRRPHQPILDPLNTP